jgi:hypothetical protein
LWDSCVGGGQYFLYYSYRRNPTGKEFFVPAGTLILPRPRKSHTPTTHSWPELVNFFKKIGTPFFADQPPGLSYLPWRVESKGAAGISRKPITLRFVGYLLLPIGHAGEAQCQSCRNAGGAKVGW